MLEKTWETTMAFLRGRKSAYRNTFSTSNLASRIVLEDLAVFCRANETCVVVGDHDRSQVLEGRREVWLRINQHLHLSPEQLFELYTGKGLQQ